MAEEELRKQIIALVEKHGMKIGMAVTFPIYRILPVEVQLALKVLEKHGMKISFTLERK